MQFYLEWFVVAFGIAIVVYVSQHAIVYIRTEMPLFTAIGWSEIAQVVAMMMTLAFSVLALVGTLPNTPAWVQAVFRIVIFSACGITSSLIRNRCRPLLSSILKLGKKDETGES